MSETAKILIVDDQASNLFALEKVLKTLDVSIVKATNGNDALLETLNHTFALAIIDVQMLKMDGYELATLLRNDAKTRYLPIIFLSAVYLDDPYIFKGYSSGGVDFITKPFNPDILVSKVRIFLELNAQRNEIDRRKSELESLVQQLEGQIKARKQAEAELLKMRMLKSLGILAGGIAHDFNNILTAVMGQIELARLEIGFNMSAAQYLNAAVDNVMRATELTAKFITFSSGGQPYMAKTSSQKLIKDVVKPALNGFKMNYEFSVADDLWDVNVDCGQIGQVFSALIANAGEAMPEGGTLKIQAQNVTIDQNDRISGLTPIVGPYVKISLSDQGHGIDQEKLEKVFDPYFSTKMRGANKGMGLGLSIAHSIISQHNGYIQLESTKGVGTCCRIYLPAV